VAEQAISRIKVMANWISPSARAAGRPLHGLACKGREIDFRVSIMPSIFGEDAVLRILDKQRLADAVQRPDAGLAGLRGRDRALIRRFAREPYGMLLVTGPTGSGKTTTLYAALSETSTATTRSSPSKTRWSTSCPACCRSR
jgi:general secretion pathway protein E